MLLKHKVDHSTGNPAMLWLKIAGRCVINLGFNQLTTIPFSVASGDTQPTLVNVGPFRSTCFYNVITTFFSPYLYVFIP